MVAYLCEFLFVFVKKRSVQKNGTEKEEEEEKTKGKNPLLSFEKQKNGKGQKTTKY